MGRKHAYPALPQQTRPWNMGPEGLSGPTVNSREMLLQWKLSSNTAFILRLDTCHGRDPEHLCLHSVLGSPALNLLGPRGFSRTSAEGVQGDRAKGWEGSSGSRTAFFTSRRQATAAKAMGENYSLIFPRKFVLCFTAFTDVFSKDRKP